MSTKAPFESHPELTRWLRMLAGTIEGMSHSEWNAFVETINTALLAERSKSV